ncbi:MAG TPA: hypothetical protein VK131_04520 [Candidatus Acidoferrales bacterium]|nr:hypothetical protein [Candidatus Acidoferrales bacterium]
MQALVRGEPHALWLTRRGSRLILRLLDPGGGEVEWADSAFTTVNPHLAFDSLRQRIDLVALYAGGPFPEDLMPYFSQDETFGGTRYRAEWTGWDEFEAWLGAS